MHDRAILPDDASRAWFFVVDAGRARLLRCSRVEHGRLRVDEVSAIENGEGEHEHGRPSPRTGRSGNTYASAGHEDEHRRHAFAKEVVAWMEQQAASIDASSVGLFAAPRFLGELRKLYGPALAARVQEQPADLTHLAPCGLARHPAVAELLSG